ncbi:fatty acid desaturase [Paraglaciecola sp. L3A3]|uniref:fatty acid desaturase n=1 Tax=Paraglaciecola sp. L3A3 TaxID=2686358 RepID=UPI00131DCCF5|nr:fatty acid desaturase [Paraglaciecola sp. L3A3]
MQNNQDRKVIREIVSYIKSQESDLRSRVPFLAQQNTLGLTILLLSVLGFVATGVLYFYAVIPAWLCIVVAALFASIAHEIEHDLIHQLYFKSNAAMYNFMMFMVWVIRPNTISPWYRKNIHLNHHKTSGTSQDIEERLVGNGIKSHALRFLVICDGLLGLIIRNKQFSREIKGYQFFSLFNAGLPLTTVYYMLIYVFLLFHGVNFIAESATIAINYPVWLLNLMQWVNFIMVVWVVPSFLRAACLNFVTSSMHYYGAAFNLIKQTQVLNHWAYLPFQAFCCNFGNTHTIHHFVPNQPFYIRQLISKKVNQLLKDKGIRFNDLASISSANRYQTSQAEG